MELKRLTLALAAIPLSLIIGTLVSAQFAINSIEYSNKSIIDDTKILPALKQFAKTVNGKNLAVSTDAPIIVYITHAKPWVPFAAKSEPQVVLQMKAHSSQYLLVVENHSDSAALKTLFSSTGLKSLQKDFREVDTYKTDYFTLHLYELV